MIETALEKCVGEHILKLVQTLLEADVYCSPFFYMKMTDLSGNMLFNPFTGKFFLHRFCFKKINQSGKKVPSNHILNS